MDPKEIQLTATQKIVPLLKAINEEVPWQMVLVIAVALLAAIFGGAAVGVIFPEYPIFDFVLRRLMIGFIFGVVAFFATGLTVMTIEDKIIPLISRIRKHYEKHALVQKKKVLDEVIDEEILK